MTGFWILLPLLLLPAGVRAQDVAPSSNQPIEILADQALEWDKTSQTYTASGNARATQGNFSVAADRMVARYEGDQSNLSTIDATGNVSITSDGRIAKGDKGIYDIQTGDAVLTGSSLSLTMPDTVITARDRFTVNTKTNLFSAQGRAIAEQAAQKRRIEGDTLQATFARDATGKTALSTMRADGNVVIVADADRVTGDHALYNAVTRQAEVTGGTVTLTRGPNVMTGVRATVDLNTNISRLFGGQTQPAKAVFYPKSNETTP